MAKSTARTSTTRSAGTRRGEMSVYTALLVIAALILGAGVTVLCLSNMKQAESGGQPGSPLNLIR
ncbi:MAG: hypothetical protein DWI09_04490 [Planctomycetota bacterium]|jgi:hypothetical protein|nr:MAG: hypothetical protein DWI09_04490 [Planctomycetota bacterium]